MADDPLLDIAAAAQALTAHYERKFTAAQLRSLADRDKLPFFKDMASGKRLIKRSVLIEFYERQQRHAVREAHKRIDRRAGFG
ncbi:hypothetical protein [Parvibaculum sp. MBR-TMA-1.3b-4.2]|jgi:hypothetical protein